MNRFEHKEKENSHQEVNQMFISNQDLDKYQDTLTEYYDLIRQNNISDEDADRIGEILDEALTDGTLSFWLNRVDVYHLEELEFLNEENIEIYENKKSIINEFIISESETDSANADVLISIPSPISEGESLSYVDIDETPEEQKIYEYVKEIASKEPSVAIQRFRNLFIEGGKGQDFDIQEALQKVLEKDDIEIRFSHFLNRCFYTLINPWQIHYRLHSKLYPNIVNVLETIEYFSSSLHPKSGSSYKLYSLMKDFLETEQYMNLCRLKLNKGMGLNKKNENLDSLIHRYPFIYSSSLLTPKSGDAQTKMINDLRLIRQEKFDYQLARFRNYSCQASPSIIKNFNPTLLTDEDLNSALNYYINLRNTSKVSEFIKHTKKINNHGRQAEFKEDFCRYLIEPISEFRSKRITNQFRDNILKSLSYIDIQNSSQDEMVKIICKQLLSFLIAESQENPNCYQFINLISNIGVKLTIGLLLRIILFCQDVRPYFENQFAILFNHFNQCDSDLQNSLVWFVRIFEHLNVALSSNFSTKFQILIER